METKDTQANVSALAQFKRKRLASGTSAGHVMEQWPSTLGFEYASDWHYDAPISTPVDGDAKVTAMRTCSRSGPSLTTTRPQAESLAKLGASPDNDWKRRPAVLRPVNGWTRPAGVTKR